MIDIRDSGAESYGDVAGAKLWYTLGGLFFWEFITTLDYEWSVIRGRVPYRWTIWLYSFARVATLVVILLMTVVQDAATPHNCQVMLIIQLTLCHLSLAAAEIIIILRIIAIWNRKKVVIWIAIGLWVTNFAFLIQDVVTARSEWLPTDFACEGPSPRNFELTLMVTLTTCIVLLFVALLGLFRLRRHGGGRFGLVLLLWKQGLIWFALAIASELPVAVSIILNLGYAHDIMLQPPAAIVMTIAATRMHRALVGFAYGSTDNAFDTLQNGGPPVSRIEWTPASQSTVRRIEVTMHKTNEQYPTSQSSQHGSFVGKEKRHDSLNTNDSIVGHEMGEGRDGKSLTPV